LNKGANFGMRKPTNESEKEKKKKDKKKKKN